MLITRTWFHCFVQSVGNRAPCGYPHHNGAGRDQRQASQNGVRGVQEGCGGSRRKVCPQLQGPVSGDCTLTLIQHVLGSQRDLGIVLLLCSILLYCYYYYYYYYYSNECCCFYHSSYNESVWRGTR